MNILGFDTGLNKTYIALQNHEKLFSKIIESTDDKYHSAFLIDEIVKILSEHNLRPEDIDLFSVNVGPGSFTGIRVALTVARGISQATNSNVVCVNSLELISAAYGLPAITILDARKNKAYAGNDQKVELIDIENLADTLKNYDGKIISDTKMREVLSENQIKSINFENDDKDFGKILITLAIEKYKLKRFTKWQGVKPLYIQPPPIHVKKN